MKKAFAIILTVMLCATAVFTLVACTEFEDEGVTVELYTNMGGNLSQIVADYIKVFNKMYPKITIKHTPLGGQYSDLNKRISEELKNNDGPALAYCYPDHVSGYIDQGNKVVCLDDFINSTDVVPVGKFGNTEEYPVGLTQAQVNDFIPAFYNEGKESYGDGTKMYSLPFAKSSEVMYYNKTFFDAHSDPTKEDYIEIPTHWWCNDSCPENCKSSMEYVCNTILTKIDSNCVPFGYDSEDNFFITLAEQLQTLPENEGKILYTTADVDNPNDHYVFNNPEMREMMLKLNEWYGLNYFRTKSTNGDAYMSTAFKGEDAKLKQCYMCIGSTGGATYQVPSNAKFEIGITEIPQINLDNPKVISQGPSLCMLRNKGNQTKDQQLASWLWLKFMTTNIAFQARISMSNGYAPVIQSVQEDAYYKNNYLNLPESLSDEDRVKSIAVTQCLKQASSYYTSPAFPGSAEARTQVGAMLVACIKEEGTKEAITAKIQQHFQDTVNACQFYGINGGN